ncbi:MAG TPA: response regulator [Gemmatimonadaceae bacterium]|jgi:CheY-like chemotaxis protein|nr:response regulator [Gemmatimonadaceae bacterium]
MRRTADQTVLIVEPDADARASLRSTLEADGYTVVATSGADDALSLIDHPRITLVVTELYLRNRGSRCLLSAICTRSPRRRAKVMAYTTHGRARDRAWAAASGADAYVLKRNGAARLLEVVGKLSGAR